MVNKEFDCWYVRILVVLQTSQYDLPVKFI